MKKLLMSVIGSLVVDTGMQPLVIVVVKIIGDAALRIRQVGKKGSLTNFQDLRFEARPQAFGLRIIIAVALPGTTAAALRAYGSVVVQQLPIRVAAVLPTLPGTTPVGMHEQAWSRRLGPKRSL